MMGPRQRREAKLFYANVNLDLRVAPDHRLRKVAAMIDFSFVRTEVASLYGQVGNPSEDPTVILKMFFLMFFEKVESERALMRDLACRLDWLWFLDLDLDDAIPHHSVLSKARDRWGRAVFTRFFQRVLRQGVDAGLVDGGRVHIDASLIAANADRHKLTLALTLVSDELYGQLEAAAQAPPTPVQKPASSELPAARQSVPAERPDSPVRKPAPMPLPEGAPEPVRGPRQPAAVAPQSLPPLAPGTWYCPTDPEARLTRKYGQSILGYKDHRVIDDRYGIITATLTTAASVSEASMLQAVLNQHEDNTGLTVAEPTADKGYGTVDNYSWLRQRGARPCIPHPVVREDPTKFRRAQFIYDPKANTYLCPAGQLLTCRGAPSEDRYRYQTARGVCEACPLRAQCTASAQRRVLGRQVHQEDIDWADNALSPPQRRARMRRRKIRAEGSFADAANRHGYKRERGPKGPGLWDRYGSNALHHRNRLSPGKTGTPGPTALKQPRWAAPR